MSDSGIKRKRSEDSPQPVSQIDPAILNWMNTYQTLGPETFQLYAPISQIMANAGQLPVSRTRPRMPSRMPFQQFAASFLPHFQQALMQQQMQQQIQQQVDPQSSQQNYEPQLQRNMQRQRQMFEQTYDLSEPEMQQMNTHTQEKPKRGRPQKMQRQKSPSCDLSQPNMQRQMKLELQQEMQSQEQQNMQSQNQQNIQSQMHENMNPLLQQIFASYSSSTSAHQQMNLQTMYQPPAQQMDQAYQSNNFSLASVNQSRPPTPERASTSFQEETENDEYVNKIVTTAF